MAMNSPCAACKFLRRKCTEDCVFAPYFPPDQPQKFANVHRIFGASNVAKLLNEIHASQREDAVNSLAYEAEARMRDPVYGSAGVISVLQHRLKQIQSDLVNARKELATYVGPQVMYPIIQPSMFMAQQQQASSSSGVPQNLMTGIPIEQRSGGSMVIGQHQQPHQHQQHHHHHHHHQQQHQQPMFEAQQFAAAMAAREQEQEMFRTYEQQQQQQGILRYNNTGFDGPGSSSVTATGLNQIRDSAMLPSLALGNFHNPTYQIQAQHYSHHHVQPQLLIQPQEAKPQSQQSQQTQQQQQRSGNEEGRSIGPSS